MKLEKKRKETRKKKIRIYKYKETKDNENKNKKIFFAFFFAEKRSVFCFFSVFKRKRTLWTKRKTMRKRV